MTRSVLAATLAMAALLTLPSGPVPGVASQAVQAPTPDAVLPADVEALSAPPAPVPVGPETTALRADLDRLVRAHGWRDAQWGVLVVSLDRRDTLFAHQPDLPLAPASNMKLFSTAAALYYLGPDFRYSTYALADGPVSGGVLDGDLILYGTGDPAISRRMLEGAGAAFRALADSLVAEGIREIRGAVVGDGSYFDDAFFGEGWKEEYRLAAYSAPIGALSFSENVVSVRVQPGAPGGPAEIRTIPEARGLAVANQVVTTTTGVSRVRFEHTEHGLTVSGQIRAGTAPVARSLTVYDPVNYATAAFAAVLEDRGIRVHGGLRTVSQAEDSRVALSGLSSRVGNGDEAPPRVLAVHLSPTLLELATVTNHVSQNLFAEALMKTVGRVALGEGTFEGGARAIQYFLECEGEFPVNGVRFVDGSGLSPLNRVTARSTIQLLDLLARSNVWEPFNASLPPAGQPSERMPHSLRNRMGLTPAAGNARAKTGTIESVSSLSGYVTAANGERLAFSIYSNEVPSTALAKRTEDAIVIRLARFTRSVDAPAAIEAESESDRAGEPATGAEAPERGAAAARPEAATGAAPPTTSAPQAPAAPRPATREHRVASGETLDGIARRYGISVRELQQANPGIDPRRLQVGRRLTIPAR